MAFGFEHSMIHWHRAFTLVLLSGLFLSFAGLLKTEEEPAVPASKEPVVAVKGMARSACAYRLQKVLSKMAGVEKAEVQLEKEQATLVLAPNAKVTDKQIAEKVRNAGFVPGKIEWRSVSRKANAENGSE